MNLLEYLGHAQQSESSRNRISMLLEKGLNDPDILKRFIINEQDLFVKQEVFLILGEK